MTTELVDAIAKIGLRATEIMIQVEPQPQPQRRPTMPIPKPSPVGDGNCGAGVFDTVDEAAAALRDALRGFDGEYKLTLNWTIRQGEGRQA